MKRGVIIIAALLILSLIPVAYAKQEDTPGKVLSLQNRLRPRGNDERANKIDWNPSRACECSFNILGSDISSKLIIKHPNGHVIATITGIIRGLKPSAEYTVRITNGHTTINKWSMLGTWTRNVIYSGTTYTHSYTTTQADNTFTGTGRKPATGTIEATESVMGTIFGNHITFRTTYLTGDIGYIQDAVGTISSDGSICGTWTDNDGRSGTWTSPAGSAKPTEIITTPNCLTTHTITFKTNPVGSANFHINLQRDYFSSDGEHNISIRIIEGDNMILISDPITLNINE